MDILSRTINYSQPLEHDCADGTVLTVKGFSFTSDPAVKDIALEVDYDVLKIGTSSEKEAFDAMWAEMRPFFFLDIQEDHEFMEHRRACSELWASLDQTEASSTPKPPSRPRR